MKTPAIQFETLRFFFTRYKRQVFILATFSVVVGLVEAASVAVVFPILNAAFGEGAGQGNAVLQLFSWVTDLFPISDSYIVYCILFLILAVLSFIIRIVFIRYRAVFIGRLVKRTQQEVYRKYIQADYQYFVDHKQGELIYNTVSAPMSLQNLLIAVTELFSQAILSISILILLFSLSWQGTAVFLFMGLLYYIFTGYLSQKVSYSSGRAQQRAATESSVVMAETTDGIKQLKVFTVTENWIRKFNDILKEQWYHHIRFNTWQQALHPVLMFILYLLIGVVALLIRVMFPGSFQSLIPVFGTFAFAVFRMIPIMSGITTAAMQIMAALPYCETVYRILSEKLSSIESGDQEAEAFKSKIEFDNVTFAYPNRGNILEEVSITFEKGVTTALVGHSGSGKTTIVNLVLRLFDVSGGEVRIDGFDIRRYRLASWLKRIGFVSQDTIIFNDTIRNNITFGSTYSDEEVIKVSQYANAHGFISELPKGYETLVGDKGMRLSGGQKQRIAIARAMMRNPEILIFDEATNALDNISEVAVQRAIDEIARDHTLIIIAHRLSTIVNANKIIVLGDGRVLEEGTHKELMAKRSAYYDLYRSQTGNLY